MPPRMKEKFDKEILDKVSKKFHINNRFAAPKMEKIVLNVGMGRDLEGTKVKPQVKDQVLKDLASISGQKPIVIKAKKAVANFKVRQGYETHAKVTMRGIRMWEFFDRLVSISVPRIKDFRGLSDKTFDKAGNYSMGVAEQGIFPEINMAEVTASHGLNINVVFSNSNPEISRFVLTELGVPFRQPE